MAYVAQTVRPATQPRRPASVTLADRALSPGARFVVTSQCAAKPVALVAAEYLMATLTCGIAVYLSLGM
jgi:hypothetical protein